MTRSVDLPAAPPVEFDWNGAQQLLNEATTGADDGEIYLENVSSELLTWDDGRLRSASYEARVGFGLRIVSGETVAYSHSGNLDLKAVQRAARAAALAKSGHSGALALGPGRANRRVYGDFDPTAAPAFNVKADLLATVDAYLRAKDPRVVQVSVSLAGEHRDVTIMRHDGERFRDLRPLVRVGVSATVESGGRRETASAGTGGRESYDAFIQVEQWQSLADEALRVALVNLEAVAAPAGEMDVVLGPGWSGVMLHEAVGHGLEGDFNRKGTSIFAGRIGERVAAPGVTVVDDGSLERRRGSLNIDDEGTPTRRNVLIEDGMLKGYMQDRMNARLMGVDSTGNGRRESYAHEPLPRMTNTFMESGTHDPDEIIGHLKRGIYAVTLGGGQVDITNGKFVFQCAEAYLVENGRIQSPIKGATLIGDGPKAMMGIKMLGKDSKLDPGIGNCGKAGQNVPAGVGQPTLYLTGLTVGGA